jgi:membrane protease YdiL (CAAX protease family)
MMLAGILEGASQRIDSAIPVGTIFLGIMAGASLTALASLVMDCVRRRPSVRPFEDFSNQLPWTSVDIRALLGYLLGFWLLVSAIFVALVGPDGDGTLPCSDGVAILIQTILLQGTLALFLVGRLNKLRIKPLAFLGTPSPRVWYKPIPFALILYLAALPIFLAASWLWGQLLVSFGMDIHEQEAVSILQNVSESPWVRGLLIVFASFSAPILEEAIFRGVLLPVMSRQFGATYAITIVSMVFSLLHSHVEGLLPIFVISVFFSLGYVWSGSLLVPMIMHVCFNSIQLFYLYLSGPPVLP